MGKQGDQDLKVTAQEPSDGSPRLAEGEAAGGYRVELPMFEGPLDLLLHLIQKHELEILTIPIGFVTEKYVEYIKMMQEVSIDIASEYLVMAATLAYIKSRSLLPPSPEQHDETGEEIEEDPRGELIRRLLEYQKYKLAAEELGGRDVLGRDIFTRGAAFLPTSEPAPLAPMNLFQLMDAFSAVLSRVKQFEDHQVDFERISITERIGELSDILRVRGEARFEELFEGQHTRADLIVTFLAILEMTRLRMTRLRQDGPLEPIFIELAVRDDALPGEGELAGIAESYDTRVALEAEAGPERHVRDEDDDVLAPRRLREVDEDLVEDNASSDADDEHEDDAADNGEYEKD